MYCSCSNYFGPNEFGYHVVLDFVLGTLEMHWKLVSFKEGVFSRDDGGPHAQGCGAPWPYMRFSPISRGVLCASRSPRRWLGVSRWFFFPWLRVRRKKVGSCGGNGVRGKRTDGKRKVEDGDAAGVFTEAIIVVFIAGPERSEPLIL